MNRIGLFGNQAVEGSDALLEAEWLLCGFDGSEVGLSLEFAQGLFDNTVQVFSQGTIKIHAAAQC